MVTSLYTAQIKLNKEDKNYKSYLLIRNESGVLLVNNGLFVISFNSFDDFKNLTEYNNIKHIGDINI